MTSPIAISLALTGARYSPWLKDNGKFKLPEPDFYAEHMPITPEAVAHDVERAARESAIFFHVHARNPKTGAQYADLDWYRQTAQLIRGINSRYILSFPTSRKKFAIL